MPDDFTGDRGEKIDKLIAAVIDIRSSLRAMKWFVGIGLPVLASFVGLAWRDQSAKVSDLQRAMGKIEGATLGAIEPLKSASAELKTSLAAVEPLRTASTDVKNAATEMQVTAEAVSKAAQQLKSSSQDLSAAVGRLDMLTRPTTEISGVVTLNHTNLVQEGEVFMGKFQIPETVERGRIREVKVRIPPTAQIPETSFVLLTARLEFDSYWIHLAAPKKEFPALRQLILEQKRAINAEVIFVLFAG